MKNLPYRDWQAEYGTYKCRIIHAHIHSKEYLSQFSIDYVGQLIASLNTEESSVTVKDPT